MKRKLMKNLLLVLTLVVLCLAVGMTVSAEDRTIIDSGECGAEGDNVIWTLYDDGELVISGEGKMGEIYGLDKDKVKTLIIENGITELNDESCAFFDFMEEVFISDTVTTINDSAFNNCHNIKAFVVSDKNKIFSNDEFGVLFNKEKTVLLKYPQMSMYSKYIIPDSVTTIGFCAFDYNCTLLEIIIPDSVKEIKGAAFNQCINLRSLVFPANIKELYMIGEANPSLLTVTIKDGIDNIGPYFLMYSPVLNSVYIEDMDVNIEEGFLYCDVCVKEELTEEYLEFYYRAFWEEDAHWNDFNYGNDYMLKSQEYAVPKEGTPFVGTIYCHAGSTAETYAIENGVDYELTHFYKDEWTYDYDNMIRTRKCIHCDYTETETLETTENGDVEIIEPVDPDTDFTVDVIEDYVVIEETISNNITTDFEIVKAFDINLKNKDGVHVQPDGTVKVKLPLDWSKNGVYKVYRVNDDGTLTDMNAYRQGSHLVFDTDHFSIYVIVVEGAEPETPTEPDTPVTPEEETKNDLFSKIFDWLKSLFELIASMFKK